jgi:hypothetical protein
MTLSEPLRGVVAALLNSRELVINLGSDAGVKPGMKFAVLNSQGVDIVDPETEKSLGSVPIPKVIVEVARVEPKLSVARTFKKRRRNVGGSGALGLAAMGNLFEPPKWVDEWETLRIEQKPEAQEMPQSDSYVQRGDPVVEMQGDEYVTE